MKDVATKSNNLPAGLAEMATGLQQSLASAADGQQFLKFTKFGEWQYGAEATEVEKGSLWAVNPQTFGQGWIAWGDKAHDNEGEMLGEVMGPATQPMPAQPGAVEGSWSEQRAMQLACVSGEDTGTQVLYKTNSQGGLKAYNSIVIEVVKRIQSGSPEIVPVVKLEASHYTHNTYGKIYTPSLMVERWETLDATEVEPEPEEQEETPDPEPPRRRRRRAA